MLFSFFCKLDSIKAVYDLNFPSLNQKCNILSLLRESTNFLLVGMATHHRNAVSAHVITSKLASLKKHPHTHTRTAQHSTLKHNVCIHAIHTEYVDYIEEEETYILISSVQTIRSR